MNSADTITVLVGAINNPNRTAPLWGLAYIKYPGRELQPHTLPDGAIQFTLQKWDFQYKAKSQRPTNPPPADTDAIQAVLNAALAPRVKVRAVTDRKEFIEIKLEEIA